MTAACSCGWRYPEVGAREIDQAARGHSTKCHGRTVVGSLIYFAGRTVPLDGSPEARDVRALRGYNGTVSSLPSPWPGGARLADYDDNDCGD